jgi:hypothetical protein
MNSTNQEPVDRIDLLERANRICFEANVAVGNARAAFSRAKEIGPYSEFIATRNALAQALSVADEAWDEKARIINGSKVGS